MGEASQTIALVRRTGPTHRTGRVSPRWLLIALATLFAVVCQNLLIETHLHPFAKCAASVGVPSVSVSGAPKAPRHHDEGCAICREAAAAGNFLPAIAPAIREVARARIWSTPLLAIGECATPNAFERCRGPPAFPNR